MNVRRIACVFLALVLSACQRGESASDESLGARRGDSSQVAPSSTPDTVALPDGRVLLALDGEGLRFVVASTGSTRLLPFGMESAALITAVGTALAPPTSRGTSADCGAGPMDFATFAVGLSINIQHDRFVGWSTRASTTAVTLTTMSGIGVGSTRAALDAVYSATVSTTTLGEEFSAGGLAGVFDGPTAAARITAMWAGTTCLAR